MLDLNLVLSCEILFKVKAKERERAVTILQGLNANLGLGGSHLAVLSARSFSPASSKTGPYSLFSPTPYPCIQHEHTKA